MATTRLYTPTQLESLSGISRYTWRRWIKAGRLPAVKLGRRYKVFETDYLRFLESQLTTAGVPGVPYQGPSASEQEEAQASNVVIFLSKKHTVAR